MKRYPQDLTGYIFGKLTVIQRDHIHVTPSGQKVPYWLCKCECGNKCVVNGTALKNHYTTSCGCYRKKKLSETIIKLEKELLRIQTNDLFLARETELGSFPIPRLIDLYLNN